MIFDHLLVATRDKDEMFNARFTRFIYRMLQDGAINDGEHFFWNGLGGGQYTGAEPRDRKNSFANTLHHGHSKFIISRAAKLPPQGAEGKHSLGHERPDEGFLEAPQCYEAAIGTKE
jgi:hypothetical protein